MARCGRLAGWRGLATTLLGLVAVGLVPDCARATMKFGALQLSGNIETQNLVRHPSPENFQFIQNRNTVNIRVDWDWLQGGKLAERWDVPFLKKSKLYLLYRGVYDGFYDIAPADRQRGVNRIDDLVGGPIEGNNIGTCRDSRTGAFLDPCSGANTVLRKGGYSRFTDEARDSVKFENVLREAYIDLALKDAPLSFRIGRQQVIWGESDQFRLMDIWNPLDLTWHLQQEPFEKIRVPLWLVKALWDIGTVGPYSNVFVEAVWNPFDFQPGAKVDFLPRPWAAPFPSPVRAGQVQVASDSGGPQLVPIFDLQGTNFRRGDFNKNPAEASEVGGRIHAVTPQGLEFTLNYLYGRSRAIGALAGTPFGLDFERLEIQVPALDPLCSDANGDLLLCSQGGSQMKFAGRQVFPAYVKAKVRHPYTNIFGFTANFFEGDFTQTIFRMETAYQLGAAAQTRENRLHAVNQNGVQQPQQAPLAFTKRNLWSGMIGFDRPTWIRWLNNKGTWFISGQFFWSYIDGDSNSLRGANISAGAKPYFTPTGASFQQSLKENDGIGVWDNGPYAGQVERLQNASSDFEDQIRRWELLTTMAFTSFYRGGTVVPFIALAYDPMNESFLSQLMLDYFYTNDFIITLQQKYYTDFDGMSLDPWGVGGLNNRRDETGIKFTFQF